MTETWYRALTVKEVLAPLQALGLHFLGLSFGLCLHEKDTVVVVSHQV